MSIIKEIRRIHDVLYTLANKGEEELVPIMLCILHKYRKNLVNGNDENEAMEKAIYELRHGGKNELDSTLEEIQGEQTNISPLLQETLQKAKANVITISSTKYDAIMENVSENKTLLDGLKSDDFIGMLYETMVSEAFSGKNGQFFTPKTIILAMREIMAVTLMKKGNNEIKNLTVCDPCCGSARFLVYWGSLINEECSKQRASASITRETIRDAYRRCLFGVDVEEKIAGYACLNMLLHGDGSTNIENADSLNHYGFLVYWPLIKKFANEFEKKWDSNQQKYKINSDIEKKAKYIEENKDIILRVNTCDDKIDIADPTWITFITILSYLFDLEKEVGTGIRTVEKIRSLSEDKPIFHIMKHIWANNNPNISKGLDVIITNPPFGRGKNLKVNFKNASGKLILPQYKIATSLWVYNATKEQLVKAINKKKLDIKTNNKIVSNIAEEVCNALGREWLYIDDIEDVNSTLSIIDSETGDEHKIYYGEDGNPIVFKQSLPKQILFIEQFLRMIKKGGLVFTVLDTGILSNSEDEFVRKFIFRYAKVHAIIEFPHNAFKAAKTGVKTAILLLEKKSDNIDNDNDYEIFGALPTRLGYILNKQNTPPIKENDLGMVLCDYYKYLGYNRLCEKCKDSDDVNENNCMWVKEGYCSYWKEYIEKMKDEDYEVLDDSDTEEDYLEEENENEDN